MAVADSPDLATREKMIDFCKREIEIHKHQGDTTVSYLAALSSAAHHCDQVAKERHKSKYARDAAKACGDFIWEVYEAIKVDHFNRDG